MATMQSNGVELRYVREGTGDPVLLLHGFLFGSDWWRPQIDALRDRFDVVAVDLRGQMGSQTTDGGYDLWSQAEDVHGVVEQLGIAPAHLVGLSMGGMIAMRLALAHPGDARSLVLMDTSAAPEEPENAERYAAMYDVVEAGDLESVVPALPPIFLADDFIGGHPDVVEAWLDDLRAANPLGVVRAGRAIDARDDLLGRLQEIHVPALVIHGTEDVPIPLERGQEIAAGIPGAQFATVSGGHQSNVDRPDEISRLIRDFLVATSGAADTPH